jgi:hypothetical protein
MAWTSNLRRGIPETPVAPAGETGTAPPAPEDPRSRKTKVTVYLRPEIDMRLRQIQLARYEATGHRPHLSELVEEAIRALPISPPGPSGT